MDDSHLLNIKPDGQVSIDEMTANVLNNRRIQRKAFLDKAKKKIVIIAYEYKPYYNRPKKRHLGKVTAVFRSPLRNIIYRQMVAQNVPTDECLKLIKIIDEKELKKIHAERSKKLNYGFLGYYKKKNKPE